MRICSRIQMDLDTKVASRERFGMIDPDKGYEGGKTCCLQQIDNYSWDKDIYPQIHDISDDGIPRCIFVPDQRVFRQLIKAVVTKRSKETDEVFLLRLGLIDNPHAYMA